MRTLGRLDWRFWGWYTWCTVTADFLWFTDSYPSTYSIWAHRHPTKGLWLRGYSHTVCHLSGRINFNFFLIVHSSSLTLWPDCVLPWDDCTSILANWRLQLLWKWNPGQPRSSKKKVTMWHTCAIVSSVYSCLNRATVRHRYLQPLSYV